MKKENRRLSPWIGKGLLLLMLSVLLMPYLIVQLAVPDTVRVIEGQSWEFGGEMLELEAQESEWVTVNENSIRRREDIEESAYARSSAQIKLFGILPIKSVSIEVWPEKRLLAGGHTVGIDLYTDGILVLGTGKIETASGTEGSPARGILYAGDKIRRVNGQEVTTVEQVDEIIAQNGARPITIQLTRDEENLEVSITPKIGKDGKAKIGIWIRDRAQGLGTLTFVDPQSSLFGAVGHGINDVDTGEVLPIHDGLITRAKIRHVVKGEEGLPGEVEGSLTGTILGQVTENTESGVYGHYSGGQGDYAEYKIILKDQVKNGEAVILSDIVDGEIHEYTVQIEKASGLPTFNHGMVVTVTDERLLQETGGIIQGMSGCPILQDGKLIGAVTHVFVKDPTKGYGIYIENMLE
ncbi:MAG: SpoIVB peptidase [Lachnospiraceae bacterium]|jgi:stage IV sporulation protein B|nr:SpoIVB peptidase [Lachnospiraceae bacterium]